MVGVILPAATDGVRFVDSVASSLLGGVEVELETGGYSLIASMQTRNDLVRETALYDNFIKGGWVDALLLVRTRVKDSRVELARAGQAAVCDLRPHESDEPYAWVDTDTKKPFIWLLCARSSSATSALRCSTARWNTPLRGSVRQATAARWRNTGFNSIGC